ncbi:MAG: hypothetical protein GPOALKHO_002010 [Sodalis sp.]|uniref:hypothetical protein n=1 Tax=Sodalis sp. (in: enterobacteria) TaxID=1898979 RepID=UPI003872DED6|nr:MAG: hypothetical protein GPOALKHO_002010 [Sodalis sp.]
MTEQSSTSAKTWPGVPVQAGKLDGTRIIHPRRKENLIYIYANATYNFTCHSQPSPNMGVKSIRRSLISLWLQTDAPATLLPQWRNALLTVPLVIIQILENDTRMIIREIGPLHCPGNKTTMLRASKSVKTGEVIQPVN